MNQADLSKLISQLKVKITPKHRKFRTIKGPEFRLIRMRKTVTALVKHERLELNYPRADEARGYVERLISEAIRHGDCHKPTMEMADYWLEEKQLVHKLFKVLAPRYQNYNVSYTRMYKAPTPYPGGIRFKAVLELRGNPYPPLVPDQFHNRNLIHNVLLDEAKKEYRAKKYAEIANKITNEENATSKIKSEESSTSKNKSEEIIFTPEATSKENVTNKPTEI